MNRLILSAAMLSAVGVFAGGFRVSLQGVKQLAMAHTSAHTDDASAAFFNPAAIAFIPAKLSVAAGGFGVNSKITYQNLNTRQTAETDNPTGTPIYGAITYRVANNVTLGFSFTTPFGSTIQYPTDWSGREIVQKLELKAFYFEPMIAVKMAPWLSFGASYIHATGVVDWDRAATQLGGSLNLNDEKAKGDGFGFGFYFKPDEKFEASVAYRSPVDMKAQNGTVTFNVSPALYSTLGLNSAGQDSFTATLPLVDEYTVGVSYRVTPKWQLSADFNYSGWERYNKLTLDFANAPIGNQTDATILVSPKNFKNSKTFRFGTEYRFTDMIAGRLGYYYDESPYSDKNFIPETPSFNMNVITGGLGLNFGSFGVDLAVAKAFPESRMVDNDYLGFYGQAKGNFTYYGLGLRYNLIK